MLRSDFIPQRYPSLELFVIKMAQLALAMPKDTFKNVREKYQNPCGLNRVELSVTLVSNCDWYSRHMESNFVFIGLANNEFEFQETFNRQIYRLPTTVGSTEADVDMRPGGLVLLPNGNGGCFDLWDIRDRRVIKSNVKPEDRTL